MLTQRARCLERLGDPGAKEARETAGKIQPRLAVEYFFVGLDLFRGGRTREALGPLTLALQLYLEQGSGHYGTE